jgi:DinB superfamily
MRNTKFLLVLVVMAFLSTLATSQMPSPPPAKSPGDAVNAVLGIAEAEFVGAADAMPEDKYSFAPTTGEFKGVRAFAQQVKHVAATNYLFGAAILSEKPPVETGGENGPDSVKSKAEIMQFLKDSFAYLHKAVASINDKNALDEVSLFGMKLSRLSVGTFSTAHPFDHYGQMVEYLRMNGIVPPASRPRNQDIPVQR